MNLVSIAGFDPSGGAGVLLDTAVFRALGFAGTAVLTTVTVQDTKAVFRVKPLPPRFVRGQFRALERDLVLSGLKVGMAGSAENLEEISRLLAEHANIPRIVDPIFRASSGRRLMGTVSGRTVLRLFRENASVLTPNLEEAALLSGYSVRTVTEMRMAAEIIYDRTGVPCLVKGGHLSGNAVNLLYDGHREVRLSKKRIPADVHGTGCFFSAALLGFLVRTGDLAAAAKSATEWTHRAIRAAAPIGRGRAVLVPSSFPRP
jgi:hydroxymethylpyrimidine/phosphomethylpyrimidine kinase